MFSLFCPATVSCCPWSSPTEICGVELSNIFCVGHDEFCLALGLSLILIATIPGMNQIRETRWDVALPALNLESITSHLLLAHNLNAGWIYTINPPMWSVATEWQIYFLFPLLLLPIWRRFGNLATIAVAFTLGLSPLLLFEQIKTACPWFLGLFALGMVAAVVNVSRPVASEQLLKWSKALCALGLAAFFTGTITVGAQKLWQSVYFMDAIVGFTIACFLVLCTGYCFNPAKTAHPFFLRFLMSSPLVGFGMFSYSLYLVHFPILSVIHLWIRPLNLTSVEKLGFLLSVGTSVSVLLAYLFHRLFERRFMRSQSTPKA